MLLIMRKIVLSLCLGLAACQGGSNITSLQELRLNSHGEPPTLDPRKASDSVSCNILHTCFEGLTALRAAGVELAIAEKIEDDGINYVITLRDAKWSDGKPVTAFDFEKTWKMMLDPLFPCPFANDLYILKNGKNAKERVCSLDEVGVKAVDAKTLNITLEHPAPYFLNLIASRSFLPIAIHVDEKKIPYVSNGPFKIAVWKHHEEIVVEKNPHYWDAANVKLDRVHFSIVDDENTELTMFENDELDWAGYPFSSLPLDAITTIKQKYHIASKPLAGVYTYIFNTRIFPFNNKNLRRAFALAINRKEIVEDILQSGQIPATSLIPPMSHYTPTSYFNDYDVEEAKKLFSLALKEMGIKVQNFPPIVLSYNTMDSHHKIAQAIQQQWSQVFGIKIHLENMEWKVFLSTLHQQKFQVARMGGLASFDDPITFLDTYQYPLNTNNYTGWNTEAYTQALEKAEQTSNMEERIVFLKEAEKLLIEDMPVIPIYFYTQCYLKNKRVQGDYLSHLGEIDIKSISLSEPQ